MFAELLAKVGGRRPTLKIEDENDKVLAEIFQKLPFVVRLEIVQFIPFRKRFYIHRFQGDGGEEDGFLFTSNRRQISSSQYIKHLYGYFKNDHFRKPYLFRSKISYTVLQNSETFEWGEVLPKRRLRTVIFSGSLSGHTFDDFPNCVEKIVFTAPVEEKQLLTVLEKCTRIIHFKLYQNELFESKEVFNILRNIHTLRLDYTKPNPTGLFEDDETTWRTRSLWCHKMEIPERFPRLKVLRTAVRTGDEIMDLCRALPNVERLEVINLKPDENYFKALLFIIRYSNVRRMRFIDEFDFSILTSLDWRSDINEEEQVKDCKREICVTLHYVPEEVQKYLVEMGVSLRNDKELC